MPAIVKRPPPPTTAPEKPKGPSAETLALSAVVTQQAAINKTNQQIAEQNEKILTALREQVNVSTNKKIRATVERDEEGWITAINMDVIQ